MISKLRQGDKDRQPPPSATTRETLLLQYHQNLLPKQGPFALPLCLCSVIDRHNNKDKMAEADIADARAKMIAKRFGGASTSTGGKGSIRRKKKVATRSASAQSDAKLSTTLKKLGANNIPGIEEVNLFKDDGKVIHFQSPKVQASIAANTYIISGPSETKPLQELLPSIVSQLGMDNLSQLQSMAAQAGAAGAEAAAAGDDDDDDVPDLVEGNFEEVSEQS
ncbi:NAC domain containing protein [Nitzschia inconspicua]|uniref:Nascent polypeptide-associated complex subunit beta n=1 Tax=Nitzschia inconspicua TaxID=303405 RepID=A0A9K3PNP2_9STRA|nr:NAC domain containing protein [Nitzschia inconspicua]